jgi:hypothetical protein
LAATNTSTKFATCPLSSIPLELNLVPALKQLSFEITDNSCLSPFNVIVSVPINPRIANICFVLRFVYGYISLYNTNKPVSNLLPEIHLYQDPAALFCLVLIEIPISLILKTGSIKSVDQRKERLMIQQKC